MSIELPPTPATELEARAVANQLAYGFEKHKDDYWAAEYKNDPDYYFKRMLGWQSEGGVDQAVYGLYAVPPSPWHAATPVEPPVPTPVPEPPVPPNAIQTIEDQLTAIAETLKTLATKQDIADARQQFTDAVKALGKQLAAGGILGGLFKREAPPKKTGKKK